MGTVLSDEVVTLKKPFSCWGCGRVFKVGQRFRKVTTVVDGHFQHIGWCYTCEEYLSQFISLGDEIGFGDLKANDPGGWATIRHKVEGRRCMMKPITVEELWAEFKKLYVEKYPDEVEVAGETMDEEDRQVVGVLVEIMNRREAGLRKALDELAVEYLGKTW